MMRRRPRDNKRGRTPSMDSPAFCVGNLGPRQRRRRLLVAAAMALVVASAMLAGIPKDWRLALFLPLWFGALGLHQALANT
jgi:hypothetical protein